MGQTYEILDGVRRAKAAQLAGQAMIWALINGRGPEQKIPVGDLLSPKREINVTRQRELQRWLSVRDAMLSEPDLLPAIIIRRRDVGIPIANVVVVGLPQET